jgi:PAS domain S-box-containing protein/diguanylate cyclase (GGDEF)-like protein
MAGSTPAAPAVTGRSKELDALLACFFDLSADLLAVAGRDGCLQSVNPAWAAVLGFSEEDLLGRRWIDLVHPDDRERVERAAGSLVGGGPVVSFDSRCFTAGGSIRWLAWTCRPVASSMVLVAGRDVTAQQQRERIDRARALATIAIGASGDWSDAVDCVLETVRLELGWADRVAHAPLPGMRPTTNSRVVEPITPGEAGLLDDVSRELSDFDRRINARRVRRDLLDRDLVGTGVSGMREAVTGLPNEALMADRTDTAVQAAWRAKTKVAMMAIGFNGFRSVSLDQPLGPDVDDSVAREVAARLQAAAAEWGSVGRLSDSKYILLATAGIDAAGARRLAADICSGFETPLVCAGGATVGVSVGVAMYPDDAEDNLNLLRCAEAALRSSRSRASGWSCYEPAMLFEGVAAT